MILIDQFCIKVIFLITNNCSCLIITKVQFLCFQVMSNDPHHDDDSLQGTSKSCFSVVLPACVVVTCHSHVSAVAWSPNSADMMGMNQPFNLFINMPDKLSHFLSIELNEKFSTLPHHPITELYRTQYCSIGNRAIEFQLYTATGKCPHYRD